MKKKRTVLLAFLLLLFSGILWFALHRDEKIVVEGNLSATDLAEIKRLVRSEMRRRVFPDFSWASVKALPASSLTYLQSQVLFIYAPANDPVLVAIAKSRRPDASGNFPSDNLSLMKDADGWRILNESNTFWILKARTNNPGAGRR